MNEGSFTFQKCCSRRGDEGWPDHPQSSIGSARGGIGRYRGVGHCKRGLHHIGANLVAMLLEGAGFKIIDLSTDVTPETFTKAIRENRAAIMGMSALLTTTMKEMKTTIAAVHDMGVRDEVKIIIGGAPVSEAYAREIGADGYGG